MGISQSVLWKIYVGVMGTAATIAAQKLVEKAWRASTGDEPPSPNDPNVPLSQAVIWALASGVGIGIVQLLTHRYAARRFAADTGKDPKVAPLKLKL